MSVTNASRVPPRNKPEMNEEAFAAISAIAYSEAGLAISPTKSAMVHTRLARRLRSLNLGSYQEYCAFVESDAGHLERREMISALTTNVSHFFREDHHFELLRTKVLPLLSSKLESGEKIRIWSAGCSNGQEPYSLATVLLSEEKIPANADIKILATDIDPKVISFAKQGCYDSQMIAGLPEDLRDKYFHQQPAAAGSNHSEIWQANQEIKDLITFRELNLLRPWPMKGKFDIIFCRNVVIYFDEKTQEALWQKFSDQMSPGAWLFLGHSERVSEAHLDTLPPAGMTTYRRAPVPQTT